MTAYLWLAAGVAAPVSAVALVVLARAGRRVLLPALAGLVVLLLLTAVFDNVIVGTGIVAYRADRILGVRIGFAPVEDLAYTVVAALALPALWTLLAARRRPR